MGGEGGIVGLSGFFCPDCGDTCGNIFLIRQQLAEEILVIGSDQAGLETDVEAEIGVELGDGLLERCADRDFDGLGEAGLALEFVDFGFELAKREATFGATFRGREAENREEVGVVDFEVLVGVSA